MTREELQDMITDEMYRSSSANKLTARILAALAREREREGEVVLDEILVDRDGSIYLSDYAYLPISCAGKRGQLIFRPAKGGEDKCR